MSYEMLFEFLTVQDLAQLRQIVDSELKWTTGAQDVGKSVPVPLKAKIPLDDSTCVKLLKKAAEAVDGSMDSGFDWYFLKYPVGCTLPLHRDDAIFSTEHHRLNAMIQNCKQDFRINFRNVHIYERDAIIFRPDVWLHGLPDLIESERIVFSAGFFEMKHNEFKIGQHFFCGIKEWQCTDIGTRVIVAILISGDVKDDPTWLNGPPYAVAEVVFDEHDIMGCKAK